MRKKLMLTLLLIALPLAAAYANMTVAPLTQDIGIGTNGSYLVTLITNQEGSANLEWITESPVIFATVGPVGGPFSEPLAQTGSYPFTAVTGVQTFELRVQPQSGATVGTEYDISVIFDHDVVGVKALATAGVTPIPELSTVALISTGVVGLFGLARVRRRD